MFSLFLAVLLSVGIGLWTLAIGSIFTSNKNESGVFIKFVCNSILTLIFLGVAVGIMLLINTFGVVITL